MVRHLEIQREKILLKIKQLANRTKFKILEATQNTEVDITELSKMSKLAFNKCSNYCTQLEKENLVIKSKRGINTFVRSRISLEKLDSVL